MTDEVVAPLDAYATAKPDEPVFTLQGGDPLAAPLVRLWAFAARARAGARDPMVFIGSGGWLTDLANACIRHSVKHDERERDNLLLRATAAEEVSWAMDAYVAGQADEAVPTNAADTHLDELERIDLHDLRVKAAQKINNMVAELDEIDKALIGHSYPEARVYMILDIISALKSISIAIEPRRIFRKD